ncbi:MAG TPA: Hsp20/alpha crystallin family protein [Terriglobia bacterium]|nr:Hsp20/alpha crystallin family protein [Terriglobia bacterium]
MSTLIRWEPTRELATLRERMDRLFNEALGRTWGGEEGLSTGIWNPAVDVFETPDSIILKADLPDVNKNDVDVSIENNVLTIKGERKLEREMKEHNYYRMERSYGNFSRSFTLPPTVDSEKAEAEFANGVLTLTLPKREESKPRQIKVKVFSNGK